MSNGKCECQVKDHGSRFRVMVRNWPIGSERNISNYVFRKLYIKRCYPWNNFNPWCERRWNAEMDSADRWIMRANARKLDQNVYSVPRGYENFWRIINDERKWTRFEQWSGMVQIVVSKKKLYNISRNELIFNKLFSNSVLYRIKLKWRQTNYTTVLYSTTTMIQSKLLNYTVPDL